MAEQSSEVYTHKILSIKCCIESPTIKRNPVKVKNPGSNDWNKNMKSLLTNITKKFKFLVEMDESEWCISINNTIIDKTNPEQLKQILSAIPTKPIAVVEIIKTKQNDDEDGYFITVHYGDKQFKYKLDGDKEDWNEETYENIKSAIGKEFDLSDDCEIYEDVDGEEVYMDEMDDILGVFEEEEEEEIKSIHLFVKGDDDDFANELVNDISANELHEMEAILDDKSKQFKIEYKESSFVWKPQSTDNEEWDNNYSALLEAIDFKYKIEITDDGSFHIQDTDECNIECADDLRALWQQLDDEVEVAVITIYESKTPESSIGHDADSADDDGDDFNVTDDKEEEAKGDEKMQENAEKSAATSPKTETNAEEQHWSAAELIDNCKFENQFGGTIGKLIEIGSNISALGKKKTDCFTDVNGILYRVKLEDSGEDDSGIKSADHLQDLVREMFKSSSARYTLIALKFIKLLQYYVNHEEDSIIITGKYNKAILDEVTLKFHHLANAVQKPVENIYQQLKIGIPKNNNIIKHESGINDKKFIIFQLPQIVFENQQISLVNKIVLNPEYLQRFINFLVPNSSKYKCKEIYFERLKSLQISSIGLFGSREEVLSMLTNYKAISRLLSDKMAKDKKNELLNPGIHVILPINLQKPNYKWNKIIYIFYWSLTHSLDMNKMKEVKNMRRDPSCLLSRVLYEISSTVCIQVSSQELTDFGVVEEVKPEKEEKKDSEQDSKENEEDDRKKKRGRGKGRGKRRMIEITFEETKENQIFCVKTDTKKEAVAAETWRLDDSWQQFKKGDMIDCRDRRIKHQRYFLAVIEEVDDEGIFVHYEGFDVKWDQWVDTDYSTLCNCHGKCGDLVHGVAAPNSQNRNARKNGIDIRSNFKKITAYDT